MNRIRGLAPRLGVATLIPTVLAASLLALALAGCGADLTPTPDVPSAPTATADAVLAKAQEVMGQVRSYRFRVEVGYEHAEQALAGEAPLVRTGAWTLPGHWVLQVDGTDAVLQADGRVFYRRWEDPESPWLGGGPVDQFPGFVPYSPFLDLDEATLLAEETVGGVSVYRVAGKTRLDDPAFRFPTTSAMTIELLVDQESYRVLQMTIRDAYRRVRASEPGGIPEPLATTPEDAITFHYYDFNAPITIDTPDAFPRSTPPPATSSTELQAAMIHSISVIVLESDSPQYTAQVRVIQPDGCATFDHVQANHGRARPTSS